MTPIQELNQRFMRDTPMVRMGGIASDLARVTRLASAPTPDLSAVGNVIKEIKYFTEWMAGDLNLDAQEMILSLQRTIAQWKDETLEESLDQIRQKSREWSETILQISGLLKG